MKNQDPSVNALIIDNQNMDEATQLVSQEDENPYREVPPLPDNYNPEMLAPPDGIIYPEGDQTDMSQTTGNIALPQPRLIPFPIPVSMSHVSGTYISTQKRMARGIARGCRWAHSTQSCKF